MRAFFALFLLVPAAASAQDWPQWRGPTGDNHAAPHSTAPVKWSESSGIAWKTSIPGRGHSSPTIVGERIYLTTADAKAGTQSLLVVDKQSGKLLKQAIAHQGGLPEEIHGNNSHASPTVASDGKHVFALFYNSQGAWVTAFDLDGEQLWQRRVCEFAPDMFKFGFGSSPRLDGGALIVSAEYDGPDSGIYGLDPRDGSQLWKVERPQNITFSTPISAELAGRRQLLLSGAYQIASYDPASGKLIWVVEESTRATCGTMVWDPASGLAFASGGFPDSFTLAIQPDGDHEVVWSHPVMCYEQSLLVADGHVYAVSDRGVAYCWRATDGKEQWRERLGGRYSSSPLLVGDTIYATSEGGETFVFKASPERFELVAKNQLGDDCFPTTTPSDGKLYHRYGQGDGAERQEFLVAIGGSS